MWSSGHFAHFSPNNDDDPQEVDEKDLFEMQSIFLSMFATIFAICYVVMEIFGFSDGTGTESNDAVWMMVLLTFVFFTLTWILMIPGLLSKEDQLPIKELIQLTISSLFKGFVGGIGFLTLLAVTFGLLYSLLYLLAQI